MLERIFHGGNLSFLGGRALHSVLFLQLLTKTLQTSKTESQQDKSAAQFENNDENNTRHTFVALGRGHFAARVQEDGRRST